MPDLILSGVISGLAGFIISFIFYLKLRRKERTKEEGYLLFASFNGGKAAFFIGLPFVLAVAAVVFFARGRFPLFGFLLGSLFAVILSFIGERGFLSPKWGGYFFSFFGTLFSLLVLSLVLFLLKGSKAVPLFALSLSAVLFLSFFRIGKGILGEGARLAQGFSPSLSRRASGFSFIAEPFESLFISFAAAYILLLSVPERGSLLPFIFSLLLIGVASGLIGLLLSLATGRKLLFNLLVVPLLFLSACFFLSTRFSLSRDYFLVILLSIFAGMVSFLVSSYYTGRKSSGKLVESSKTGSATNIISGFALGLFSTLYPILILAFICYFSYHLLGSFGMALSALSLSSLCLPLSFLYTSETMAEGSSRVNGSWGWFFLSSSSAYLSLILAYTVIAQVVAVSVMSATVVVGLFIGGAGSFLLVSLVLAGVSGFARRDEASSPGGVASLAFYSVARALPPIIFALLFPVVVGFLLGRLALGGLLFGFFVSGVLISITMFASGGAWEQASEMVGDLKNKDKFVVRGAADGAIVGSPLARAAAPSVLNLIKLTALFSLFVVVLVIEYGSVF
jgi:hypothetical protein